jgi:hypothetical protein
MGLFATMRHSLRVLWRAARELFHEVTGTLFFLIAVSSLNSAWRAWHRGAAQWLVGVSAAFAVDRKSVV